jgi:hypothetical protein
VHLAGGARERERPGSGDEDLELPQADVSHRAYISAADEAVHEN